MEHHLSTPNYENWAYQDIVVFFAVRRDNRIKYVIPILARLTSFISRITQTYIK